MLQAVDKRLGGASLNLTSRDIGVGARELEEYTRRTKAPVEFEASPHSRRSILDQQVYCRTLALLLSCFCCVLPSKSKEGRPRVSHAYHLRVV